MPGSTESAPPSAANAPAAPAVLGDNRGIKFHIKTGNSRWACTLQDRSSYERKKAGRVDSSSWSTTSHSH